MSSTHPPTQGQPGDTARRPRRRMMRRAALAAAVLAATGGLLLPASGIASASVDQTTPQWAEIGPYGYTGDQSSQVTAVYTIQNVAEPGTEMLEDNGNSMAVGGTVDVWDQYYQQSNQDPMNPAATQITQANYLWEFVPDNPSDPSIVEGPGELINRQSGLCLDVANNNTGDGAGIDQWTCNGGTNQQWTAFQQPGSSSFELLPELDGISGFLGVGNGSTCTTNGDGDSVYVRTTGVNGNNCDQWYIQQASYDFATHPISVAPGETESDGRSYECVNSYDLRLNPEWSPQNTEDIWDIDNLSGSNVTAWAGAVGQQPQQTTVPADDVGYINEGGLTDETGQIMLYCDPSSTSP
jgi:hypothetical protein